MRQSWTRKSDKDGKTEEWRAEEWDSRRTPILPPVNGECTVASVPCSRTEEHCLVSCMCLCLPTSISHSPTIFHRFYPLYSPAMIPWVLLLLCVFGHRKFSTSSCLFIISCVSVIAVWFSDCFSKLALLWWLSLSYHLCFQALVTLHCYVCGNV